MGAGEGADLCLPLFPWMSFYCIRVRAGACVCVCTPVGNTCLAALMSRRGDTEPATSIGVGKEEPPVP